MRALCHDSTRNNAACDTGILYFYFLDLRELTGRQVRVNIRLVPLLRLAQPNERGSGVSCRSPGGAHMEPLKGTVRGLLMVAPTVLVALMPNRSAFTATTTSPSAAARDLL
jgi:hypothetical protein